MAGVIARPNENSHPKGSGIPIRSCPPRWKRRTKIFFSFPTPATSLGKWLSLSLRQFFLPTFANLMQPAFDRDQRAIELDADLLVVVPLQFPLHDGAQLVIAE